jgi:hypothetical protein
MASHLVLFGIPSIALALAALFVWGVAFTATPEARGRQALYAAGGAVAFLGYVAVLALSGALARFDLRPPPFLLWVLSTVAFALGVGLSPLGRRLAAGLPFAALVGFQAFRLPLELVMHRAADDGVMPSIMSYGGYNFDIVSGITAAILSIFLLRGKVPRGVILAWNILGSVLLAVIVTVAFLASPLVRAFGEDQINSWITQFPYAWMSVMVGAALLGHLLVARKLSAQKAPAGAAAGVTVVV